MNHDHTAQSPRNTLHQILATGVAGGVAEILWISGISLVLALNASDVAREVTASVVPQWREAGYAVVFGIVIHMVLSIVLSSVYLLTLGRWAARRFSLFGQLLTGVAALVSIWAVNFFILLPLMNPAFSDHLSYGVTLMSKVLFAVSMVLTFRAMMRSAH